MPRFHITQDETGYFQLTYENDQGELTLVSYEFDSPKQLVEDAMKMAESGEYGQAVVVVDPRRQQRVTDSARARVAHHRPAPRRAGE
jgi:Holliday junction resolvase-like predicted endonuclease